MRLSQLAGAALLLCGGFSALRADMISGTLFYTTGSGGQNVWKINYNYNGAGTFTLSGNTNVASTPGADGLLFAPDGNLLVAGQGATLTEVSTGGSLVNTVDPGNPAFHLALNNTGTTVYSLWNGSGGAQIAATPLIGGGLTGNGIAYATSLALNKSGSTDVRGVVFDPTNSTWYYGTAPDGGRGDFGTVLFNDVTHTATLTRC